MSSFMTNCEGCGYVIPKQTICPNCSHNPNRASVSGDAGNVPNATIEEFQRRRAIHTKNYGITMCLQMLVGLLGFLTSGGSIFLRMGGKAGRHAARHQRWVEGTETTGVNYEALLTLGIVVLVVVLFVSIFIWLTKNAGKFFPTELHCPECDERLDQLGSKFENCPACCVQLSYSSGSPSPSDRYAAIG